MWRGDLSKRRTAPLGCAAGLGPLRGPTGINPLATERLYDACSARQRIRRKTASALTPFATLASSTGKLHEGIDGDPTLWDLIAFGVLYPGDDRFNIGSALANDGRKCGS